MKAMSGSSQAVIINYRVGPKSQASKECILRLARVFTIAEACKLVGRKVVWKKDEGSIVGKVVGLHGKKGLLRARFRKGLPGQALGSVVELIG